MARATVGRTGATNWIDARKAFFVIESRKQGGMGAAEAVPYGNRESADAFAAANGGSRCDVRANTRTYVLAAIPPATRPNMMLPSAAQLTRTGRCQS